MSKYVGNKNIPGVIEFLVNRIPKSNNYYSLFMGSGGIENSVYTQGAKFICAEKDVSLWKYQGENRVIFKTYQDLIDKNVFTAEDFVFADPPYMFSTRRSGRRYYKYEFENSDHIEFLTHIQSMNCRVMITHPKCDLYDMYLNGWQNEPFKYMTREGSFTDSLYLNYSAADIELLNYSVLGRDFIERQAIKRQRKNIVNKLKKLPKHVLDALIIDLKKEGLIIPV